MDLHKRSTLPEKMDDLTVPGTEVAKALTELKTVNKWLGGYAVIKDSLDRIKFNGPVTLLDIGCGSGDIVRAAAGHLDKSGKKYHITGVDINPATIAIAMRQSEPVPNIAFKVADVWDDSLLASPADIVMSSMFCHHFDDESLVELVKRMCRMSRKAVLINDLHRHRFAYYSIKYITALFSGSALVKYDAPLSVARALTREEWVNVLNRAGVKKYTINWKWAWRWQIIIDK